VYYVREARVPVDHPGDVMTATALGVIIVYNVDVRAKSTHKTKTYLMRLRQY